MIIMRAILLYQSRSRDMMSRSSAHVSSDLRTQPFTKGQPENNSSNNDIYFAKTKFQKIICYR